MPCSGLAGRGPIGATRKFLHGFISRKENITTFSERIHEPPTDFESLFLFEPAVIGASTVLPTLSLILICRG